MDEVDKMNENKAGDWLEKGNRYYKQGEYKKAIDCYDKAIKINPKDAMAWNNKGNVYSELKEFAKAIE